MSTFRFCRSTVPDVGTKLEGLLFEDLVEPGTATDNSPPPPAICEYLPLAVVLP